MSTVEKFIERRFPADCNWLDGNCYYFALILKDRFPQGEIIYEPVGGHFLLKLNNKCYDYSGEHTLPEFFYIWNQLETEDSLLYQRIVRDCLK